MNLPQMDYFRAIHGSTGLTNAKDAKVEAFRRQFAYEFDASINVTHDTLRNDEPQDFIITATEEGCNFWARPGETANIGDIIYYNTLHWLVTDINFHDELTRSGKMVRCNRQIRWQDQHTGEIMERWCLITKPYSTNVNKGVNLTTGDREFQVQLSYDEDTIQVDLDRRFLLEVINGKPKAYAVTSVDAQTNRYQDIDGGFLIWNLTQVDYNPNTDNAELMIADYFDPKVDPEPEVPLLPCRINGRDTIRNDLYREYAAVFYDENGEITDDPISNWSVSDDRVNTEINDGNLRVIVPDGSLDIGEIFVISLCDEDGKYAPAQLEVEVIGLL